MKRLLIIAGLLVLSLLALVGSSALAGHKGDGNPVNATLTGFQEVPAVSSTGQGTFSAQVTTDKITYTLTHSGPRGGGNGGAHSLRPAVGGPGASSPSSAAVAGLRSARLREPSQARLLPRTSSGPLNKGSRLANLQKRSPRSAAGWPTSMSIQPSSRTARSGANLPAGMTIKEWAETTKEKAGTTTGQTTGTTRATKPAKTTSCLREGHRQAGLLSVAPVAQYSAAAVSA
jgi:hypothetical protein